MSKTYRFPTRLEEVRRAVELRAQRRHIVEDALDDRVDYIENVSVLHAVVSRGPSSPLIVGGAP